MHSRVSTYAAADAAGRWVYVGTVKCAVSLRCTARVSTRATARGHGCMRAAPARRQHVASDASGAC